MDHRHIHDRKTSSFNPTNNFSDQSSFDTIRFDKYKSFFVFDASDELGFFHEKRLQTEGIKKIMNQIDSQNWERV
jgi:hypothetical protein